MKHQPSATGPYRTPAPTVDDGPDRSDEASVGVVLLMVWIASVARVWGAVARREVAGAEVSLALLVVLLLPRALWDCLRRWITTPRADAD